MYILTPSWAFLWSNLSRRYLSFPGRRNWSSTICAFVLEASQGTQMVEITGGQPPIMDIDRLFCKQYGTRKVPKIVTLNGNRMNPEREQRLGQKLTPSTNHCAATFSRIGAKLSNLLLLVKGHVAAAFSKAAIHCNICLSFLALILSFIWLFWI